MILLIFATISGIALIAGLAVLLLAVVRTDTFEPSRVGTALSAVLPDAATTRIDSPYQRRLYDWTVEYHDPIGAQRITIGQNPASFGEEAAVETARTTAMLYRGTTIEVWATSRATGERARVDALRMESRRVA